MKISENLNGWMERNPSVHACSEAVVGGLYMKEQNLLVERWAGHDDYRFTDLTNAMKKGTTVVSYSVKTLGEYGNLIITNWLHGEFGFDLKKAFDFLAGLEYPKDFRGYRQSVELEIAGHRLQIYMSENPGHRTFSPFALHLLKPLTEEPKKWTMPHVFRALVNKQFEQLKCNGVYTDDYAYDNQVNYRQGEITDAVGFVKKLMEHPSGWKCYQYDGKISVNCHSFDTNSFVFRLEPPKEKGSHLHLVK